MARLEEGFERERRFSGYLAHELRTPLAAIRSTSEVALKWPDQASPEDFHAIARPPRVCSRRWTVSSSVPRRNRLRRDRCRETVALVRSSRNVSPCTRSEPESGMSGSPAARSKRSAANRRAPAADHRDEPDRQRRRIRAAAQRGRYRGVGRRPMFAVTNAAPALTAEDVPRLFERLWRKDAARSDAAHAGLGLSLARAARSPWASCSPPSWMEAACSECRCTAKNSRPRSSSAHLRRWHDGRMNRLLVFFLTLTVLSGAVATAQSPGTSRPVPALDEAFKRVDANQDGKLDAQEFAQIHRTFALVERR